MHARNVPAHHMPFPELVELEFNPVPYRIIDTSGKDWLPTNGMTSLVERKLLVPLVEEARNVARHELAHVKWSPPKIPRVRYDLRFLMAVEDARINLGLRSLGLPVLLGPVELAQVAGLGRHDLEARDVLAFVLRAIAALGTNADALLLEELAPHPRELRDLVRRHVSTTQAALLRGRWRRRAPVASFALVRALAAQLAKDLPSELRRLGYPSALPFPLQLAGAGCCLGHAHGDTAGARRRDAGGDAAAAGVRSGELRVVVAPLPHPTLAVRGGRRGGGRASPEGEYARYLHRWPLDGAVFRRRVRRSRAGSVLVDTSGSMSLDAAGIDEILNASAGAARIAIYSGRDGAGELRIVARDGRKADGRDLVPYGRGNVVDEPALRWLAKQPAPRLWISDGGVTGIGDQACAELQRRCQEIVERAGIRRVRNVRQAAEVLAGGSRRAGVA